MANEKRLIDANALIQQFSAGETMKTMTQNVYDAMFVKALQEAPTVDAVEVVHGRWFKTQVENCNPFDGNSCYLFDVFQCSECGAHFDVSEALNYCPNCGAKMDGDGNG